VTTSSSEPIFEAVTARGPVFRTITLRSPNGTPFVAYPEPALPRYLGAAAPSQTRRLPIATEAELPQEGSTGQTEPTASGALDLGGLGLSAFDPHSGHSFGPGGASENHYESFNQTVAAGPVGRWSPEFLGARSNAAERSASVRIPTGTVDPVVTGDPLLFRDVVAEEQDEEQPVENVDVSVPIPEPTTALFGFALLAVTASGRRRLRASAKR
jgi:hypothetical protein